MVPRRVHLLEVLMDSKTTLVLETLKKHGVSLPCCMCKVFDGPEMPVEFSGLDVHDRADIRRSLWEVRRARMHSAYRELGISASVFDELEELQDSCLSPEEFAKEVAKYLPSQDSAPSEGVVTAE